MDLIQLTKLIQNQMLFQEAPWLMKDESDREASSATAVVLERSTLFLHCIPFLDAGGSMRVGGRL